MTNHVFPPRRILLATDLSETSVAPMSLARMLHHRYGTEIGILHAHHFELPPYFSSGQLDALMAGLKESTRAAAEQLAKDSESALGFRPAIRVVEESPVEAILESAEESSVDLVLIGTHGRRGVQRLWLGSVAERVLRLSRRPVVVMHEPWSRERIDTVLCPVGFTEAGLQALNYAAEVAHAESARLIVLHSVESGQAPPASDIAGSEVCARCAVEEIVAHGDPLKSILETVQQRSPALIIMGAERKVTGLGEFFSSTTDRVMRQAPAPLLVVPRV